MAFNNWPLVQNLFCSIFFDFLIFSRSFACQKILQGLYVYINNVFIFSLNLEKYDIAHKVAIVRKVNIRIQKYNPGWTKPPNTRLLPDHFKLADRGKELFINKKMCLVYIQIVFWIFFVFFFQFISVCRGIY